MKTTIQQIEAKLTDLNTQLTEFVESKKGILYEETNLATYKAMQDQIKAAEKELAAEQLQQQIIQINDFNKRYFEAAKKIGLFSGDFVRADLKHTKKFADFILPIQQKYSVFISANYMPSGIEIKIQDNRPGNKLEFTYYIERGPGEAPKVIKFSEVMKARKKHNELLAKFEKLETELGRNYLTAIGNGSLNHSNRRNLFSDL
ncbi:hypothetical protein [uncultured Chryseobacterium sp.]|uniref:hypothetical protein n=1 Tax=uncultured Chryseobacterium sp. TaxID=259322 RepID=UPI0025FDFA32|nr:hypothetical protein [uncultured Chryseobacterium sp.]